MRISTLWMVIVMLVYLVAAFANLRWKFASLELLQLCLVLGLALGATLKATGRLNGVVFVKSGGR